MPAVIGLNACAHGGDPGETLCGPPGVAPGNMTPDGNGVLNPLCPTMSPGDSPGRAGIMTLPPAHEGLCDGKGTLLEPGACARYPWPNLAPESGGTVTEPGVTTTLLDRTLDVGRPFVGPSTALRILHVEPLDTGAASNGTTVTEVDVPSWIHPGGATGTPVADTLRTDAGEGALEPNDAPVELFGAGRYPAADRL